MKKIVNLFALGVLILLLSSFFDEKNPSNGKSAKIKSIGVKEDMILPEPYTTPLMPFVPDMVTYFNKNGREDSTVLNFYTGEKIILNYNVYDKNNRLDSIYNYERGRKVSKIEAFEYDEKNNLAVKIITLYSDENKYFYTYDAQNNLIEEVGFNTNDKSIDTIYWHKFRYEKGLLVENANLYGNSKIRKHHITYNELGDEIGAIFTSKSLKNGVIIDYSTSISKEYKYNKFDDWVECAVTSTSYENGKKEIYNNLIRREIKYY